MRAPHVAAVVALVAFATAPVALSAPHTKKVDPFAAGWRIAAKASGYCSSSSLATKRSDAFQCYRGSFQIVDPCFALPGVAGAVRCVDAPWSRTAVELQLTKPLPAIGAGTASVWAVDLANGGRCASTGANGTSFGQVIEWTCTNGELARGLHSGATWWASWQPSNGVRWKHVSIRTLYR